MEMRKRTTRGKPYEKPNKRDFLKKIRKEIVSYTGLNVVYDRIYQCLDLDPRHVILITGEKGTGKERVARAIYDHGDRTNGPFVVVNCAAIPETLIESELFGHIRGAFTGASADRKGKFAEAESGVLFFDEIGNLSQRAQQVLLRAIESRDINGKDAREIQRVGKDTGLSVDVKIVAATNKDLRQEVQDERFLPDLYDRLKGFMIDIPPLRKRILDIPPLIRYFTEKENKRTGKSVRGLEWDFDLFCIGHDWPGNVRELEGFVARCHTSCKSGETLSISDGEDFFSDDEAKQTRLMEFLGVLPTTVPLVLFRLVMDRIMTHKPKELVRILNLRRETSSNVDGKDDKCWDVQLEHIPKQGIHRLEVAQKDAPSEVSQVREELLQKMKKRERLTDEEMEFIALAQAAGTEEWDRMEEPDKAYVKWVMRFFWLFGRCEKSLASRMLPRTKKDLFDLPLEQAKIEFEKERVRRALERNDWNVSRTATEMKMTPQGLYKKLKKLNLRIPKNRP